MINLKRGHFVNFLSVRDTVIPYADQGLVLITGENGNGKSALFIEGPYYGLFGGSIRYGDKPSDAIIREGEKAFAVILDIDIDGEDYRIVRCKNFKKLKLEGYPDYPSGLSVWHNGNDEARGHKADTQEWLNRLYGMGPRTFLNSSMFTVDTMRFPLLTDAKKKEILDELLRLSALEGALKDTKARKVALETEVTQLRSKKELLETQIPQIEAEIVSIQTKNDEWATQRETRANQIKAQLVGAKATADEARSTLQAMREGYQTAQSEYSIRHKKLEKAKAVVQAARETFLTEKASLDSKVFNQKGVVDALRANFKSHTSLMGMPCPKCKQGVPHNPEWVAEQEAKIQEEADKHAALVAEIEATKGRSDELKAAQAMIAEKEQKLSKRSKKIEAIVKLVDKANDDLANATTFVTRLETNLANIENETNPYGAQLQGAQGRLEKARASLQEISNSGDDKIKAFEREKIFEQCYGSKGCRTLLLERVIPSLNLAASEVRQLLDTQMVVSFNVRGDDESYAGTFEVVVENPGRASDYRGDSAGERRRVDMILMFSLMRLAAQRGSKSVNQGWFDEPFENLDDKGQQGVLNILKHEASKRNSLFAITHAGYEVKGSVAKVWHVYPGGEVDFGG